MGQTFRFKLILFGSPAVGKTSIIERYVNNRFEEEYISTLGYNVFEKNINFSDNNISFMIFDIGGQEQFVELRKKYAAGARAALIVFDLTNRDTFNEVKKWHADLINFADNASFILVGNKVDLENLRQVQTDEGVQLAQELGAEGFFETSAKTNIEIDNTFHKLAEKLLNKTIS